METTHSTRTKSVANTLLDAALYLDTYGWCQGDTFKDVPGNLPRACALGAIHVATYGHDYDEESRTLERDTAYNRTVNYLADFLDDGIWRDDETPPEVVWKFNDHPDSTHHLVTHALRAAAKRAEAELIYGQPVAS